MTRSRWIGAVLLVSSVAGLAQEKGQWRASSKTAKSITGDITFANEKLAINFYTFTIAQIRELTAAEMNAAFGAAGSGNLYRTSIPGNRTFLHKNTICGSEDTQWVVTLVSGKTLQIAFFSGAAMPVLTAEGLTDNASLCGTYSYVK